MAHAQSAFPNHRHTPTGRTKLIPRPKIALDVPGKLFGPEVLIGAAAFQSKMICCTFGAAGDLHDFDPNHLGRFGSR
jgi:hypothetical protein